MSKVLSRSTTAGTSHKYKTLYYLGNDTVYTLTVDPFLEGFNYNITFSGYGCSVDMFLSSSYSPQVGDQIRVMVKPIAKVTNHHYVFIGFPGGAYGTILTTDNSPAVFEYTVDYNGDALWTRLSTVTNTNTSLTVDCNSEESGKALGSWFTFTRALEPPTGVSDDSQLRQTMSMGTQDNYYCAAYHRHYSGGDGPGFLWMGRPDEGKLHLQSLGSFPPIIQAVVTNYSGSFMAIGGIDGTVDTPSLSNHVSIGSYGGTWVDTAMPTYSGTFLRCQPSSWGDNVVFAMKGSSTYDVFCYTYDFGTTWYQQPVNISGTCGGVYANNLYVYYADGVNLYRIAVGSTTVVLCYTADNVITHVGVALNGGVIVTTTNADTYVSRSGEAGTWRAGGNQAAAMRIAHLCNNGRNYLVVSPWYSSAGTRDLYYSWDFMCRYPLFLSVLPMSDASDTASELYGLGIYDGYNCTWITTPAPTAFAAVPQADLTASFTMINWRGR